MGLLCHGWVKRGQSKYVVESYLRIFMDLTCIIIRQQGAVLSMFENSKGMDERASGMDGVGNRVQVQVLARGRSFPALVNVRLSWHEAVQQFVTHQPNNVSNANICNMQQTVTIGI
jgi:hypothetical protein